jgi:hypothetical protein
MMLSEGKTCSKRYFATEIHMHFLQREQHFYAIQTKGLSIMKGLHFWLHWHTVFISESESMKTFWDWSNNKIKIDVKIYNSFLFVQNTVNYFTKHTEFLYIILITGC